MPNPFRDHFDPTKHTLIDLQGRPVEGVPNQEPSKIFDREKIDKELKRKGIKLHGYNDAFVRETAASKFMEARKKPYDIDDVDVFDDNAVGDRAREILHAEALEDNSRWIANQIRKINDKIQARQELDRNDLIFIYTGEVYLPEHRQAIQDIKGHTDFKKDVPIILGAEIAWSQGEINDNSEVYIGPLFKELFSQRNNLEAIYTCFPDGLIHFQSITIRYKTSDEMLNALRVKGITVISSLELLIQNKFGNEWQAKEMPTVLVEGGIEDKIEMVALTVKDLGFTKVASLDEVCKRAIELGLSIPSPQIALHYRLEYVDRAEDDKLFVPIRVEDFGQPNVFVLYEKVANYPRITSLQVDSGKAVFSLNQRFSFELLPIELSEDDNPDKL